MDAAQLEAAVNKEKVDKWLSSTFFDDVMKARTEFDLNNVDMIYGLICGLVTCVGVTRTPMSVCTSIILLFIAKMARLVDKQDEIAAMYDAAEAIEKASTAAAQPPKQE